MMRRVSLAIAAWLIGGCSAGDPKTLGSKVEGAPVSVAAVQQAVVETPVVIRGAMTKKCPVSGCWFLLHDDTGTIKVDTKSAGFVVVDVPLNTRLTVAGRVVTNGGDRFIDATGLRY